MKLKEMIDNVFPHNELVTLWDKDKETQSELLVYEGIARKMPEKYLNRECKIYGVFGLEMKYIRYINIKLL